jgi:4'-phosphopantetheinyl transferase
VQVRAYLTPDEAVRGERYARPILRDRFVAARGQLRELLGAYLGTDPASVTLVPDIRGKPQVVASGPFCHFQMNVSHSGPLALYAMSIDQVVGVDVEEAKSFPDMPTVAARYYSASERRELTCADRLDYVGAFFRCWTRKEAYLKAIGLGLRVPLDSFDVSLSTHTPRLLRANDPNEPVAQWSLFHLAPAMSFVGALAVRSPQATLRLAAIPSRGIRSISAAPKVTGEQRCSVGL